MTGMTDPAIREEFVLADIQDNHNKVWKVEWWPDGRLEVKWGRVGAALQSQSKAGISRACVEAKMAEKEAKGYKRLDLHCPAAVIVGSTAGIDPKVAELMTFVGTEAGARISSYSAVPVSALSVAQIEKGRQCLHLFRAASGAARAAHAEGYLNAVPTKLPFARLTEGALVDWMTAEIASLYGQLDQLEASLAVHNATVTGSQSVFAGLDVEIEAVGAGQARDALARYILGTAHHGTRIRELYQVAIKPERAAWERETRGKSFVTALFHGTKSHNLQKILRTGLIIPQVAANGSRFGRGVYFADKAERSQNYAGSNSNSWRVVLVADVALGNPKVLDGDCPGLTSAPTGRDSVRGIKSWSGMDEFIVYRTSQQTIRALAVLE